MTAALATGFAALVVMLGITGRPVVRRPDPLDAHARVGAGPRTRRHLFGAHPIQALPGRRVPTAVSPSALASWADDLSRSLRHGSTLRAALAEVLPDDPALIDHTAPLRHWLHRGATVGDACDEWSDELATGDRARGPDRIELLATMSAVLGAVSMLGGSAAAPLDRFAGTMRQRASDDLERGAQSAQAALSARVLTTVPLAVLALLLGTDADVRSIVTQPSGAAVLTIGLGLNALGAWWMRRIVSAPGSRR